MANRERAYHEMQQDIFKDDFDDDIDIEVDFVGRENDLDELQKAWKSHKIFGIFGLRSVGKSRLVTEFLNRKSDKFVRLYTDMKLISDTKSLYTKLCASYGMEPELKAVDGNRWVYHICEAVRAANGKYFIFVFDNTEDYQEFKGVDIRDSFFLLCTTLVRQCTNMKIFITSTTRVQFAQLKKVYFSHEVFPLKQRETRYLLKSVTEGIDLGEYENSIVNLCEGLPLLALMVGSELTEDFGMVTPKDMVEFLLTCRLKALSREFYPQEDRVGKCRIYFMIYYQSG